MSRRPLVAGALLMLVAAGCGGSGLNFWLYPEPRLAEAEEAVFVAYESHQVLSIDGEDTAMKCWARRTAPEAYSRTDIPCRLHLLPGEHDLVFHPRVNDPQRVSTTFTALPGKAYGLDWSACRSSGSKLGETCIVTVVEIGDVGGGG